MKDRLRAAAAALASLLVFAPRAASADCKMLLIAEFHADVASGVPVLSGAINGKPIKILIDSGAGASLVMRNSAERLGLAEARLVGQRMYGLGGSTEVSSSMIKELKVDKFVTNNLLLRVAGDRDIQYPFDLVLGDDFLSQTDVEFDLADGFIRLFKPQGCQAAQLVYWNKPYSQATLLPWPSWGPSISTQVQLNGQKMLARLDSGASQSTVDVAAAESVGVTRGSAGGTGAMRGLGPELDEDWAANFDSFAFGDETIAHPRLHVTRMLSRFQEGETGSHLERRFGDAPAVLLGADFLRAHRVFVANQEHLIVFSYSGGPVFLSASELAVLEYDKAISLNPADADAYVKRGAARYRLKQLDLALQDLDRAIGLKPSAEAYLERAITYRTKGDFDAAARDYDESIRLKPDDYRARIDRAAFHLDRGDLAPAIADFDEAIHLKPDAGVAFLYRGVAHRRNGDLGLALQDEDQAVRLSPYNDTALAERAEVHAARGEMDLALKDFDDAMRLGPNDADNYISRGSVHTDRREIPDAVRDFDQALRLRPGDSGALNGRCWARAVGDTELDAALADCNASVERDPLEADTLDSRAFVHFRLGQFDKTVADEDAALKINPKLAASLYVRGLAKHRLGDVLAGDADLAAARAIEPKVADTYARMGVSP